MKDFTIICIVVLIFSLFSCKDHETPIDPVTASLVPLLDAELTPLTQDPAQWTDSELRFLDAFSHNAIVGFGEATHGTSEFFKAKHRMFRYLVENHGFRIFAIEADVGESMLINEAVLAGDKSKIVGLMKEKMQFWTWKTNEVRDMLFWMCDYNLGKPEVDKLQYWGVDCQFNIFNPDIVKEQLTAANVSFLPFAQEVLNNAKTATGNLFSGYTVETFDVYQKNLAALTDSLTKYKEYIVAAGSEKKYELTLQLVEVIGQTSEVMYYNGKNTRNYRDEYMAKNVAWLNKYFDGSPMVLWAHNFHISYNVTSFSMGYYIASDFPSDYARLGFLFSKGTFMAVTQEGEVYKGLAVQSLNADPKAGSVNDVMSRAESPVFTVGLPLLERHQEWTTAFANGMQSFEMGAVYNNKPEYYYQPFRTVYFNQVIYFNTTTAATQVE